MASGIVTFEELQERSGYSQTAKVIEYLNSRRIKFHVDRHGRPWTTLDALAARSFLGQHYEPPTFPFHRKSGLLSTEEILSLPDNVDGERCDPPGLYFLIANCEIVYIGKSYGIGTRVTQHWQERLYRKGSKKWDAERYLIAEDYDFWESRYINALQPKFNKIYRG
jgi:hypothetical protein